jgi:DNA-binding NtrC family response regulator
VVDDDEDVLTMLVEMLRDAGFCVTPADRGRAMRDILGVENPAINAVVLHCRLPGEPSAQLALHAKSLNLPVVMISGHIEAMQFADENGLQLLAKPFRMAGLLNAIDEACEAASSDSATFSAPFGFASLPRRHPTGTNSVTSPAVNEVWPTLINPAPNWFGPRDPDSRRRPS